MAIVITGNPGVGKHTITKKIAKRQELEILDINDIAMKNKDIIEKSKETTDVVNLKKLKSILKEKITKKSIIVGHLAPYVLTKRQVKIAIVLRKNPYKLEYIYKKRKYSKNKIRDNQAAEILGIITHDTITKFGYEKTVQIDTSDQSINQTVKAAEDIILSSSSSSLDKNHSHHPQEHTTTIDWLTLVSKNNNKKDMEKFFPTN